MKKMLSTMLTALVLSAAVVTTVDAYTTKTRKSTARSTTRGGRSARSSRKATPGAKEVLAPAKEALEMKKEDPAAALESAKEVAAVLTSPELTDAQKQLVSARIDEINAERDVKLQRQIRDDIGYGWFGIGSTKEQKEEYKKANDELNTLIKKHKDAKAKVRELEVETGRAWSNAVRVGVGVLVATGIAVIAYGVDQYMFEGAGTKYVSETGMGAYQGAKGSVMGAYESAKGSAMGLYESTPDVPYFGSKARAARAAE